MAALTERGFAVALVLWLIIFFFSYGHFSCVASACGRGDLWMAGILGAGLLVPAYFATALLATLFPGLKLADPDDHGAR